jgi:hypothetical protein
MSAKLASFVALAALVASPAFSASGEVPGPAAATGCFTDPALVRAEDAAAFLRDPEASIAALPDELAIVGQVRLVVMSDPSAVEPMVALLTSLPAARANAVAAGLGRAAGECEPTQLQVATDIQNRVAAIDNVDVLTAFMAALGQQGTAAIGEDLPAMGNGGAIPLGDVGQLGAGNNYIKGANDSTPINPFVFSKFSAGTYTYDSVSPTT